MLTKMVSLICAGVLFVMPVAMSLFFSLLLPSAMVLAQEQPIGWTSSASALTAPPQCLVPPKHQGLVTSEQGFSASSVTTTTIQNKKTTYTIGVLANRGEETAYAEYNATFADYLSLVTDSRFDPAIDFRMEAVPFAAAVDSMSQLDLVFSNPSVQSCVQSEVGASPLVTQIASRNVAGQVYELTQFGGVIFTAANNTDIQSIADIRGKRIATVSLTGLGSGQMQFAELQAHGLHHLQDPAQLVFTSTQGKVVNAVLLGQADVGFVRTDQLERSKDPRTGLPLDLNEIKVIGNHRQNDQAFPFLHSTPLYPEWGLASRTTVPDAVAREVQTAMLNMANHARVGRALRDCLDAKEYTTANTNVNAAILTACWNDLDPSLFAKCDTTPEIALTAARALTNGKMAGWVPPASYMSLRNLQEEIGFIGKFTQDNRDNANASASKIACVRQASIDDAVVCPPRHFKKRLQDMLTGCETAGLDCHGYPCLCSPCVKAFDVSFFPVPQPIQEQDHLIDSTDNVQAGCSKFQVCGEVEQASQLRLRVVDNKARPNATFSANVIIGWETHVRDMVRLDTDEYIGHEFVFDAINQEVGFVIVEVFADGEQIDQSPFRLLVTERDCAMEDSRREADTLGNCVCAGHTATVGGSCIPYAVLLPCIIGPLSLVCAVAVYLYVEKKKRDADSVWLVKPEEVEFEDPPRVLGKGTFGLVLLAEYRGTQVAVKRVLPPKDAVGGSSKASNSLNSRKRQQASSRSSQMDSVVVSDPEMQEAAPSSEDNQQFESKLRNYLSKGSKTTQNITTSTQGLEIEGVEDMMSGNNNTRTVFDLDLGTRSLILSRSVKLSGGTREPSVPQDFGTNSGFFHGKSFAIGLANTTGNSHQNKSLGRWSKSEYAKLQSDFIEEMRYLSKLRHPCITTAMGKYSDTEVSIAPFLFFLNVAISPHDSQYQTNRGRDIEKSRTNAADGVHATRVLVWSNSKHLDGARKRSYSSNASKRCPRHPFSSLCHTSSAAW